MKKVMIVLAAAFMFAACGNNNVGTKQSTTDSTTVTTDSTKVDTIASHEVDENGFTVSGNVLDTLTEPKPKSLPKVK